MMKEKPITTLFLDVGDVLLTNGFEHESRALAAKTFDLDLEEMNLRHQLIFSTYELGKITLDEYLSQVVFYQKRTFTRSQFRKFMFAQSKPYPQMIELVCKLKAKYALKIAVVSNEARELNAFRIRKFKLDRFVDFFISSCFVHIRKPDAAIYRLALDIAQTPAGQVLYVENTPLFVQVAEGLGIRGLIHTGYESTRDKLASFGLNSDEGDIHETI
jgi:putative hydrolase of the HAD superfamily